MDIPISFDNTVGIVIIAMLIGLFVWMYHRRLRPEASVKAEKELGFAYEWVATPVSESQEGFRPLSRTDGRREAWRRVTA